MESLFVSEVTVLGVGSRFKSGGTIGVTRDVEIVQTSLLCSDTAKNFSEVD